MASWILQERVSTDVSRLWHILRYNFKVSWPPPPTNSPQYHDDMALNFLSGVSVADSSLSILECIITVRNSSCGKVMFHKRVCVCPGRPPPLLPLRQTVRILLECILVLTIHLGSHQIITARNILRLNKYIVLYEIGGMNVIKINLRKSINGGLSLALLKPISCSTFNAT